MNRAIFVIVFAIVADLFNTTNAVALNVINVLGNPILLCILGSRMFFNLKEAAEHGVNVGTNWSSYSQSATSTMHFNEPPDSLLESVIYRCSFALRESLFIFLKPIGLMEQAAH